MSLPDILYYSKASLTHSSLIFALKNPSHFTTIITIIMKFTLTLLLATFLGLSSALAQHKSLHANDVFKIEKRTCSETRRWASMAACEADGCQVCVKNIVLCNVSNWFLLSCWDGLELAGYVVRGIVANMRGWV